VGLEEFAPGLAMVMSFSNVGVLASEQGLVLLDTSSPFFAARVHEEVRSWSKDWVHTAIYTHGHVDHVFGLPPFEQEVADQPSKKIRVLAHQACVDRFDRYRLTNGYNARINQRQFGLPIAFFPEQFRYPDETMDQPSMELTVGTETMVVHHDKGETDDHLWIWIPKHKAIYTGDLFIWAAPNCGNPQKVQRYPREWSQALRKMAKYEAEILIPGHGPPILGHARIQQALNDSAQLLEQIVEQTLQMMNQGAKLNDILHSIELPEQLLTRPYLRAVYDDPLFIVRNLWRLYGGWYDGNPSHLKPAADHALACAIADSAGGVDGLIHQAEKLLEKEQTALACHLIEFAVQANPAHCKAHQLRSLIYGKRVEEETSLMAKAIFRAAHQESSEIAKQNT
jgi:alkyl sulfatase BDS1-like metallo-beta-lactamase superfamily hydrolase